MDRLHTVSSGGRTNVGPGVMFRLTNECTNGRTDGLMMSPVDIRNRGRRAWGRNKDGKTCVDTFLKKKVAK